MSSLARTKIVCTIGPASSTESVLVEMIEAGMNVARINFSHGDYDSNLALLEKVRKAARTVGKPVAILQDLQGPKIRVGVLPGEGMALLEEKIVKLRAGVVEAEEGVIPVPYERLAVDVGKGDRLLLDDGTKELEVISVKGSQITAKVILGGTLISHKGINVPSASLTVESLTDKDIEDLKFGLKQDLDFVALSFVRRQSDVEDLKKLISENLPDGIEAPAVIVKIEKHEALDNFDEILEATDGVMIARGDLGLETPAASVPIHQKDLIAKCVVVGKPVIVATQMLESMQKSPRPTRAEVSDVANAVIDHTDAVMLSGESAMGEYPVRSVEVMSEVIAETQETPLDDLLPDKETKSESVPAAVAGAAVEIARKISAKAIMVATRSGYSARAVSRLRPEFPIYAVTDSARTRQQLVLSWGVVPVEMDGYEKPQKMTRQAVDKLVEDGVVSAGDKIVVVAGLADEAGKFNSALRVVEV